MNKSGKNIFSFHLTNTADTIIIIHPKYDQNITNTWHSFTRNEATEKVNRWNDF